MAESITTMSATLPESIQYINNGLVGDKCYLIGGVTGSGYINDIYSYDLVADVISSAGTLPYGYYGSTVGVVDGLIYMIGGQKSGSAMDAINKYDPSVPTFTELNAVLPSPRFNQPGTNVGANIYSFGGFGTIYKYDTLADTLTTLSESVNLNFNRFSSALASNGKIYIFGNTANVYEFDPATDTLIAKTAMVGATLESCATAIGDYVYLFGGSSHRTQIVKYDPAADAFTTSSLVMPEQFTRGTAITFDGCAYLFSGRYTNKIFKYDPGSITPPEPTSSGNMFLMF